MGKKQLKAIIIGAGLSGLTTAAYLARQGVKVVVYERSSNIGGGAHGLLECMKTI